jgi:uncharacterized protein (DUF1778 family)
MDTLQEAADLTGATLNQFLVQAALEKAKQIIDREHTIGVSRRDAAALLDLLDNPKSPNAALTRAFGRHKKDNNDAPNNEPGPATRNTAV